MSSTPLLKGEGLYALIPQRPPIVMVDTLVSADDNGAVTGLHVNADNMFCSDNVLREAGMIEHVAQSAAAFAGYTPYLRGETPKLGFIGEIKKFRIVRLPKTGEYITTHLNILGEAAGVTLISAQTESADEVLATCQMKIFIKED